MSQSNLSGVTYYKSEKRYDGDYTKNCGLTGVEIDSNFHFLRGRDVKDIKISENGSLDIYLLDGSVFSVENFKEYIDSELGNISFSGSTYDKENGVLLLTTNGETAYEIGGFFTNNDVYVYVANGLYGNGSVCNPLRVPGVKETGFFAPISEYIDGPLNIEEVSKEKRYLTKELVSDKGYFYNKNGVNEVIRILAQENSKWHVPSFEELGGMLNGLELCGDEFKTHLNREHGFYGKDAGFAAKSDEWDEQTLGNNTICIYPTELGTAEIWTNDNERLSKSFVKNNGKVETVVLPTTGFYPIRLVMDLPCGNGYQDTVLINGTPYKTVIMTHYVDGEETVKLWLKTNLALQLENRELYTEAESSEFVYRYYVNEFDPIFNRWVKEEFRNGYSAIIENFNERNNEEIVNINGELVIKRDAYVFSGIAEERAERIEGDRILDSKIEEEKRERQISEEELANRIILLIKKEKDERIESDSDLFSNIESEKEERIQNVNSLNSKIDAETEERVSNVEELTNLLSEETQNRIAKDEELLEGLHEERDERLISDSNIIRAMFYSDMELNDKIDRSVSELNNRIDAEERERMESVSALTEALAEEQEARVEADEQEKQARLHAVSALTEALAEEQEARVEADEQEKQARLHAVSALTEALAEEQEARVEADEIIENRIDDIKNELDEKIVDDETLEKLVVTINGKKYLVNREKLEAPEIPTLTESGTFISALTVNITTVENDVEVHYLIGKNSEPEDPTATTGTIGRTILLSQDNENPNVTYIVKAVAVKNGLCSYVAEGEYVINSKVPNVVIGTPSGSEVTNSRSVSLSCPLSIENVVIKYTIDGTSPKTSSTAEILTGTSIQISTAGTYTVRAYATVLGWIDSDITQSQSFIVRRLNNVTISSPTGSSSSESRSVTLSCASSPVGTEIVYTTDGTNPKTSQSASVLIGTSIQLTVAGTYVVKAYARCEGWTSSVNVSQSSSIVVRKLPNVTVQVSGDNTSNPRTVTLSNTNTLAKIHYTLNGATPTSSSPTYVPGEPIVLDHTKTVKAIAIREGWTSSDVVSQSVIVGYFTMYYGYSGATMTLENIPNLPGRKEGGQPAGTYTAETHVNAYLWICIDNRLTFTSVKSNGFDVPFDMDNPLLLGDYSCYCSSVEHAAGTITFVIE